MAITDITFFGDVCVSLARGSIGTLSDINVNVGERFAGVVCMNIIRGNVGSLTDIGVLQPIHFKLSTAYPDQANVKIGTQYGVDGTQYTGSMIVGGTASHYATIAKETGSNARGGSGACARFTPTSTTNYGYWYLYVPTTASTSFVLSFYHKISTGWNGTLKLSIYDTDQTTLLTSSSTITTTNDGAYHIYTASAVTPSTTGMCLIRLEIQNGSTDGYVFIDDISAL